MFITKNVISFQLGLESALATGKQYIPWIHIEDIVQLYVSAIENESLNGIYNAVAPEYVTNFDFSKQMAKTINKPYFLPATPTFLLKLVFGEMHQIVTEGSRVSLDKILSTGYDFKFPSLEKSFEDLLKNANPFIYPR